MAHGVRGSAECFRRARHSRAVVARVRDLATCVASVTSITRVASFTSVARITSIAAISGIAGISGITGWTGISGIARLACVAGISSVASVVQAPRVAGIVLQTGTTRVGNRLETGEPGALDRHRARAQRGSEQRHEYSLPRQHQ
jgi:hypothetical protein